MLFYIVIALITTLFYFLSIQNFERKPAFHLYYIMFLLVPSVIGGCRDLTVGTDITTYGEEYFRDADAATSLGNYLENVPSKEYAYYLLNYVCSIFGGINFFFFVSELVKMFFIGATALQYRKKINSTIFVFTYMLFLYWLSLSMMRQGLAVCVAAYAFSQYYRGRHLWFVLLGVLGVLFHSSGVFIFMIALVDYIYKKTSWPIVCNGIILVLISVFSLSILMLFSSASFLREGLVDLYLDSGVPLAKTNIVIAVFLVVLSFLPLYFADSEGNGESGYVKYTVRIHAMYCLFFLLMSDSYEVAFRISFYNMMVLMLAFPLLTKFMRRSIWQNVTMACYLLLFLVHYIANSVHGLAETLPYSSSILHLTIG